MKKIKNLLFVLNSSKPKSRVIGESLAQAARENGISVEIHEDYPVAFDVFEGKDACCVIGGDGTVLSCVKAAARYDIPLFGINLGKLGFLAHFTDISKETFLKLLTGENRLVERTLLEVSLPDSDPDFPDIALNDFVIKGASPLTLPDLRASVDGELIADYSADGLIFSTPTGSTAYNLSAGGPIIHPRANVFIMTPICPHTLSNRSLVLSADSKIRLQCEGSDCVLISDGRDDAVLKKGSVIEIGVYKKPLRFLRMKEHSHFSILRSKLGWAEDPRKHFNNQ